MGGACAGGAGGVVGQVVLPRERAGCGEAGRDGKWVAWGVAEGSREARISPGSGCTPRRRVVSGQEIDLVGVLERGDRAGRLGEGQVEMAQGARGGRKRLAAGRRVIACEAGSEVGLSPVPAAQPAIGGGDGEREGSVMPDAVERASPGDAGDQLDERGGGDAGTGDEVAPKQGEGAAAAGPVAAVGTKKRMRRISRWWPSGR